MGRHGGFLIFLDKNDLDPFLNNLSSVCEELIPEKGSVPGLRSYQVIRLKLPLESQEDFTFDLYATLGSEYASINIVAPYEDLTCLIFDSMEIRKYFFNLAKKNGAIGIVMDDGANSFYGIFFSVLDPTKSFEIPKDLSHFEKVDDLAKFVADLGTLDSHGEITE